MIVEELLTSQEAAFSAYCALCGRDGLSRSDGLATFQTHTAKCGQICIGGEEVPGRPVHVGQNCLQCGRVA
jgi:hypothetical protein